MFMKMYDEKEKKDAETNKSNQIKSNNQNEVVETSIYYVMTMLICSNILFVEHFVRT